MKKTLENNFYKKEVRKSAFGIMDTNRNYCSGHSCYVSNSYLFQRIWEKNIKSE